MSPAALLMLYIHTSHSFNDVNNSCFVISADIDECTSGVNDCHKLLHVRTRKDPTVAHVNLLTREMGKIAPRL